MTEIEYLFSNTVKDLEKRNSSGTKYDLIISADLLRKLLFDEQPLINKVNRIYKLKIKFEIKCWPKSEPRAGKLELRTVQPEKEDKTMLVDLSCFLSTPCLYYHENVFTVKDILHHVAYFKGGVHTTPKKKDIKEKGVILTDNIMQNLKFGFSGSETVEFGIGLIKPISIVTIKAIEPLVNKIK